MSMARRILIFGGLGLTVPHAINIAAGRHMWWWIAVTYTALAGLALCAHLRKWTA